MDRLFLFPMLFALTGLVFALTLGLSPDTAHSAAPDDDDDDEWEELISSGPGRMRTYNQGIMSPLLCHGATGPAIIEQS